MGPSFLFLMPGAGIPLVEEAGRAVGHGWLSTGPFTKEAIRLPWRGPVFDPLNFRQGSAREPWTRP